MTDDFLNLEGDEDARIAQRKAALEVASLYLVFQTNDQARDLLAMWDKTLRRRRTPVTATVQEYAANEAVRAFIEGIYDQIELAKQLKGSVT